jgi:hypothetical protein
VSPGDGGYALAGGDGLYEFRVPAVGPSNDNNAQPATTALRPIPVQAL